MNKTSGQRLLPISASDPCCASLQPGQWSDERTGKISQQMKVLADPARLRLLELLARQTEPVCVCDITGQMSQHQPTVSHHLRILRETGLVECEKRGVWAYYWATPAGRARIAWCDML